MHLSTLSEVKLFSLPDTLSILFYLLHEQAFPCKIKAEFPNASLQGVHEGKAMAEDAFALDLQFKKGLFSGEIIPTCPGPEKFSSPLATPKGDQQPFCLSNPGALHCLFPGHLQGL